MQIHDVRRALLTVTGQALSLSAARGAAIGAPRRVLVIRPDHLGDMLFAVPALRLLRAYLPEAHITVLAGPWSAEIVERLPYLDEVRTLPFPWFDRQPKPAPWEPYQRLVADTAELRQSSFDLAIVLRFDHWWGALLAALAGIPRRVGYDVPECRPFLSQAVPYVAGRHEVQQNIRLVAAACGQPEPAGGPETLPLEFPLSSEERSAAAARVAGAEGLIRVALHVGAGAPVKLWPPDHYVRLGNLLQDRGAQIVLTGSASEGGLVAQIADGLQDQPVRVVGAPLGEVAAVLERCDLAFGVDSGILHLAVAAGTPTVHLYGPVGPDAFGPWGDPARHRVVFTSLACAPCNRLDYPPEYLPAHRCIRDISVERVVGAIDAVLQESAPSTGSRHGESPPETGRGHAHRH